MYRSRLKAENKVDQVESQDDKSSTFESSDEEYTSGLQNRETFNDPKLENLKQWMSYLTLMYVFVSGLGPNLAAQALGIASGKY
ncbi:hypothetical protein CHS0354_037694 [Potamilus streckersoni]|uniref:Uncharacterized protein n=1 Tax=Potamilus streckersoni TaxID=2493646 RepID=A0AAE0W525_9BIVA|nr:hypothetical protein CHS0354_037694 [Potamilus streckersoni]